MAGSNADFDAADFRAKIQFAMTMGTVPVSEDQVAWHFESTLMYTGTPTTDAEGIPFDPTAIVTRVEPATAQVPCAVEFADASRTSTAFGFVTPTRVRITLLDDDYTTVKDAVFVTIAGDRYDFRYTEPPSGLFDVGLYVMHFEARNET